MKGMLYILMILAMAGCEKFSRDSETDSPYKDTGHLILNDTVDLHVNGCVADEFGKKTVCFHGVISDSRCPEDVLCIWAGEATASFSVIIPPYPAEKVEIKLGQKVVVHDFVISFTALKPYPNTKKEINPGDYLASIVVTRP